MIDNKFIKYEYELLAKIDKGLSLSKDEIEDIRWICLIVDLNVIDETEQIKEIEAVVQIGNRFFLVYWFDGKTENQESIYWTQKLKEVKEVEEIRVVKTWEPIK